MATQLNKSFHFLLSKIFFCETHMPDNVFIFTYDILTLGKGCRWKEKCLWKEFHKPFKEQLLNAPSNGTLKWTGLPKWYVHLFINLKQEEAMLLYNLISWITLPEFPSVIAAPNFSEGCSQWWDSNIG